MATSSWFSRVIARTVTAQPLGNDNLNLWLIILSSLYVGLCNISLISWTGYCQQEVIIHDQPQL